MSTLVSDFIEEIQDRIPENELPNLFPALSRAVKMASDRLYVLGSGLIIEELSVSAFASVSYTAATIAFFDGGISAADTITDSASQLVVEGFKAGMPIETDCSGNTGPFKLSSVASGAMTLDAEYSVATQVAGSSYTITSVADFAYLPTGFSGFVERPYISGYAWELLPLPSQNVALCYSSAGQPKFYKLKGNRLYLYPGTSTDIVIKGDYYKKATAITSMNDYVPFYGELDAALQEYLVAILNGKSSKVTEDLIKAADLVATKRDNKAPVPMPGGLDWGF